MRYALGLDLGTQGAKGVLLDERGTVVAAAARAYAIETPRPGWAEQDPRVWDQAVGEICHELTARADGRIAAIGLSGQMHGVVLVDAAGRSIRPCMLWGDARGNAYCAEIARRIPDITRITGNPVMSAFSAPRLMWIGRHEPDSLDRASTFLLPKDYLRLRLTGRVATDPTDAAGTLLFDLRAWKWAIEIAGELGVPARLLPEIMETGEEAGAVTEEASSHTNLPSGIPVITGGADMAMGLLGSGEAGRGVGAIRDGGSGVAVVLIGTGGQVLVRCPGVVETGLGRIYFLAFCFPRTTYAMGAIFSAGLSLRWLRDVLGAGTDYDALTSAASGVAPGAEGVMFLPYLLGTGTPHMDAVARGAFVGLDLHHGRAHLTRAVMEGVAFGLRDSIDALREGGVPISEIRVGGGGARSPLWRQILADVLDAPVRPLLNPDASPVGAAVLAGVRVGLYPDAATPLRQAAPLGDAGSPSGDHARAYDGIYARYRELYQQLRTWYARCGPSAGGPAECGPTSNGPSAPRPA